MFQRLKSAELFSRLPREACVERLRASVLSPWSFSATGIVGRVGDETLTLRCAIWYRNSFQTFLRGKLTKELDGTRILCRFGMSRFVLVFMSVWFGGVVLIGGSIFIKSLVAILHGRNLSELPSLMGTIIPLIMVAFGIGLLNFGWYLARDERSKMIEFLTQNLDAHEISSSVKPLSPT